MVLKLHYYDEYGIGSLLSSLSITQYIKICNVMQAGCFIQDYVYLGRTFRETCVQDAHIHE